MSRQTAILLRELQDQGFTAKITGKCHYLIAAPDGQVVTTLAGTPGGGRAYQNEISRLKRHGFLPGRKKK